MFWWKESTAKTDEFIENYKSKILESNLIFSHLLIEGLINGLKIDWDFLAIWEKKH